MSDRVTCECGCKQTFVPNRPWQRFVDTKHKAHYHANLRTELCRRAMKNPGLVRAAEAAAPAHRSGP